MFRSQLDLPSWKLEQDKVGWSEKHAIHVQFFLEIINRLDWQKLNVSVFARFIRRRIRCRKFQSGEGKPACEH